ncbi:unnamed protein product [Diatraea saccharalis]|uniref:RecQ-mediated genome instability protein 1 n=1 Tax=Diatraea saccharalis TaxID=40085 RepID=A0A9P0CA03_9NEOP|nr:unnamed protein product [Diatraea saccharalis]
MSVNMIVNTVRHYLVSQYMYTVDEWLTGCVEFLTDDNGSNFSEIDIKNLAREQWLLNDLKDICPGCLPQNLKDNKRTILNAKYILQINAVVDIGTPAYQQYLKLQKVNMENIEATTTFEDKVSSHRMLKLYLTDGVQEISGIEYRPMRNLSCDITPGCKVLIKGPVECRRGVLLLTESVIELLGGEVQEMAITNSLAGLLSTKLGLPLESNHNSTMTQSRNPNIPTPHAQMPSRVDEVQTQDQSSRPVAVVTSLQVAHSMPDADDDIDIDDIAAIEAEYCNPGKRPLNDNNSKPDKKLKTDIKNTVNRADEYPDDDECFFGEDEDYLREVEAQMEAQEKGSTQKCEGPMVLSAEPYVYIKQINDMNEANKSGRVFKVKAQIMKLLSKLSVGKDGWSLRCTLIDGTGCIDVDFTSDVLSKLVGFTPQEMNLMKKQMATDLTVKEKAVLVSTLAWTDL